MYPFQYVSITPPSCQGLDIDCLVRGSGVPETVLHLSLIWFFLLCYSNYRFKYYSSKCFQIFFFLLSFNDVSDGLGNIICSFILSVQYVFLRPFWHPLQDVLFFQVSVHLILSWNWKQLLFILNNLISSPSLSNLLYYEVMSCKSSLNSQQTIVLFM